MWQLIFFTVLTVLLLGFLWMTFAVCRFNTLRRILPQKRWKRVLCGFGIVLLLMAALYLVFDFVNMVMVFLHLLVTWMLCDIICFIIKRLRKTAFQHYYAGTAAFLLTTIWLGIGYYNAHHICCTEYHLTTSKPIGTKPLTIVGLSDSHVGATFHWQEFESYIDRINAEYPDLVVIMGDFVDDDTSLEDMVNSCKALSRLQARYGVFFVYGNHDEGYWRNSGRGYTLDDLDAHLETNGVKILRDEMVTLNDHLLLCGRLDKSRSRDRRSAHSMMTECSAADYVICLDHEPNDYTAEAASRMDLVISGHTHGGQFLGLGQIGVMMGANDAYYGHEQRDSTHFLISSGIGDWALQFKTGCISEYIVVHVN